MDGPALKALRRSLKLPMRAPVIDIVDEFIEIVQSLERRIRLLEQSQEELD
jgi:hypothetical protein